jgi:hypothetical protein
MTLSLAARCRRGAIRVVLAREVNTDFIEDLRQRLSEESKVAPRHREGARWRIIFLRLEI